MTQQQHLRLGVNIVHPLEVTGSRKGAFDVVHDDYHKKHLLRFADTVHRTKYAQ